MTQQHLYEWIAHPELLNRDTLYELRTLLARYPYFQTVRLLYLKNLFLLHDITFGEELRRAALYIADRKVLFYLIEGERFTITPSEGKEKSSDLLGLDRTLSLIDAFLAGQPEEEQKDITQLPMDITTDYTSYLLTETEEAVPVEEIPSLKGQDLIDTLRANREICVGMAANMIGVNKSVIVVAAGPFQFAMVNPVITKKSGEYQTEESCLSLDGARNCTRYKEIEVDYLDQNFKPQHGKYSGWTAQIIQHEIDHCDGILI